jgi:DDE_Tnp_1-associated
MAILRVPRSRLAVLLRHFSQIQDGRQSRRVAFPRAEMLLLLTCATVADCDDFDEIVAWGNHHLDFLRRFAPFHFGIPCARWLRTLVNPSGSAAVRELFRELDQGTLARPAWSAVPLIGAVGDTNERHSGCGPSPDPCGGANLCDRRLRRTIARCGGLGAINRSEVPTSPLANAAGCD